MAVSSMNIKWVTLDPMHVSLGRYHMIQTGLFPHHHLLLPWMISQFHDDVIKWKHFPRYLPFVRGIHKDQWWGALMLSLIWAWINGWVNNRKAGDSRRHCAHYDAIVKYFGDDASLADIYGCSIFYVHIVFDVQHLEWTHREIIIWLY